ncbi:MAG: ferritin-like protein [Flaviaesturariibacter sp.]|nr:ferritin-like protein [Flaviaesturariibacter sp.]
MAKATATKSAATKKTAAASTQSEESMLKDLFIEELKDIYWAEKHLTKSMPKMRKGATSEELASAFENHLAQTAEQIARIEEVFEMLETTARAKKCDAMEGLVKEAQSVLEDTPKGSAVRDVALIIHAQKIEHYEIASYGSLVQLAKTMGRNDIADVLQVTLDEEKTTDQLLTQLAESGINISADNEMEK